MGFFQPQPSPGQPQSPPPLFTPQKPFGPTYLIDCVYQNTYVWLLTGESFWFYPTRVESGEVTGYRWNGVYWQFYGIDPRLIDSVVCYPTPTLY